MKKKGTPQRPARKTPTAKRADGVVVRVSREKGHGINLYIYPDDLRLLDALCRAWELSRAAVIAKLIRKHTGAE